MENASRELNHDAAKALLEGCRKKGWQVIFLGADFDNAQQATSYGNMGAQTVSSSVRNMGATMASMASKRGFYGATGQAMAYSDDEKTELAKK
jgi:hypothetical protein